MCARGCAESVVIVASGNHRIGAGFCFGPAPSTWQDSVDLDSDMLCARQTQAMREPEFLRLRPLTLPGRAQNMGCQNEGPTAFHNTSTLEASGPA